MNHLDLDCAHSILDGMTSCPKSQHNQRSLRVKHSVTMNSVYLESLICTTEKYKPICRYLFTTLYTYLSRGYMTLLCLSLYGFFHRISLITGHIFWVRISQCWRPLPGDGNTDDSWLREKYVGVGMLGTATFLTEDGSMETAEAGCDGCCQAETWEASVRHQEKTQQTSLASISRQPVLHILALNVSTRSFFEAWTLIIFIRPRISQDFLPVSLCLTFSNV